MATFEGIHSKKSKKSRHSLNPNISKWILMHQLAKTKTDVTKISFTTNLRKNQFPVCLLGRN